MTLTALQRRHIARKARDDARDAWRAAGDAWSDGWPLSRQRQEWVSAPHAGRDYSPGREIAHSVGFQAFFSSLDIEPRSSAEERAVFDVYDAWHKREIEEQAAIDLGCACATLYPEADDGESLVFDVARQVLRSNRGTATMEAVRNAIIASNTP